MPKTLHIASLLILLILSAFVSLGGHPGTASEIAGKDNTPIAKSKSPAPGFGTDSLVMGKTNPSGEVKVLTLPAPNVTVTMGSPSSLLLSKGPSKLSNGVVVPTTSAIAADGPQAVNPSTSFDGLQFGSNGVYFNSYTPPDVQLGVGPNYVEEQVNLLGAVWTKQGSEVKVFQLSSFYANMINSTDSLTDPQILYDSGSGRWFSTLMDENSSSVLLAVSASGDPTGTWDIYRFVAHNSYCPDQPILGLSSDQVTISMNNYPSGCSGQFIESEYLVLNSSELVSFASVDYYYFLSSADFSVHPVDSVSSSSAQYLVCSTCTVNSIELLTVTGVPPTVPTVQKVVLPIGTISVPPNATQAGSTRTFSPGDGRMLSAVYDKGKIWLAFADGCYPQGDTTQRSCARLVQVDPIQQTVLQNIDLGEKGVYYLYPALMVDSAGNLVVIVGYSSSSIYPSLLLTGQSVGGPLNTVENATVLKVGTGPVICRTSNCRYGDYFGSAVDSSGTVWVAGEYGKSTGWGTFVASVQTSVSAPAQVVLTFDFSVVNGGSGYAAPQLTYTSNGVTHSAILANAPVTFTVDSGTTWSITNPLVGSSTNERWQTQQPISGVANSDGSFSLVYTHQYYVSLSYVVVGGGSGYAPPLVTLTVFGMQTSTPTGGSAWVDAGTGYEFPAQLSGGSISERWMTQNSSGLIEQGLSVSAEYFHQFALTSSFEVQGGGSPPDPVLNFTTFGAPSSARLTSQPQTVWADSGTGFSVPSTLNSSLSGERWTVTNPESGLVSGAMTIAPVFQHEYLISLRTSPPEGGNVSVSSGWYASGSMLKIEALVQNGWQFEEWSGSGSSSYSGQNVSLSVVVNSPTNETAIFYPGLLIESSGEGSVSYAYSSSTGVVAPGTSKTVYVPVGTTVSLEGTPSSLLYSFSGWSETLSGSPAQAQTTVNSPLTVQALFSYNYTVILGAIGIVVVVAAGSLFFVRGRKRNTGTSSFVQPPGTN